MNLDIFLQLTDERCIDRMHLKVEIVAGQDQESMKHFRTFTSLFLLGSYLFVTAGYAADTNNNALVFGDEPIQPIEADKTLDPRKVALGSKLFNDVRLSKNDSISCSTCHQMQRGGTVNQPLAPPGVNGKQVPINVPTIFGSGHSFAQFWDGRAASLEDQMNGPTQNADEMGSNWDQIVGKLKADPEYSKSFKAIYHTPPTEKSIKDAIATFERSLTPINAAFDRYLKGDAKAISPQAKEGYALFKSLGCSSCHQGQSVGGNMYQKFGVMKDYFHDRGHVIDKDYGRYNVTHAEEDRYFFKVPSLRNVELTAPYFHDGSAKTMEDAVDVMAKYQLGRKLTPEERVKLVAYLKTLTGTLPPSP